MDLFFPIAGVNLQLLWIVGLGLLIGLISGLFGVGGGFLSTPLLIMMGIPAPVAVASGATVNIGTSTSGSIAHYLQGNIDGKMGTLLFFGGSIGGICGTFVIKWLREMGNADFVIKLSYVILLGVVGGFMFYDGWRYLRRKNEQEPAPASKEFALLKSMPGKTKFPASNIEISWIIPTVLGMLVGLISAIMGVGGGFLMVPVLAYFLRMPMKMVVGTSLFQILLTSFIITVMHASVNHSVDIFLALAVLIGSTVGAQAGVRIGQHLSGQQLKIFLAIIVLLVAVRMFADLLTEPGFLLAPLGGF